MLDKVKKLKPGESFSITAEKGSTAARLMARLGVTLYRAIKSGTIRIPEGCRLRKRTILGSEVIEIALLPLRG